MVRAVSISICHGGGPLPVMGHAGSAEIAKSMKTTVPKLLRLGTPDAPRAIVVVTAHWSERRPTISNGAKHALYYDYGGFPPETYKLKYDAPGSPDVAQEIFNALKDVGLDPAMDSKRGWDHGVFIPMLLINPTADIPIIQLSVIDSESPRELFDMGRALSSLRDRNIAILGSGATSFHNNSLFFSGGVNHPTFRQRSSEWSKALSKVIEQEDPSERLKQLERWRDLPGARDMHPERGVEHFLPLIVCAGAGGDGRAQKYGDEMMGVEMFTYYWT